MPTPVTPLDVSEQVTAVLVTFRSRHIIEESLKSLIQDHGLKHLIVVDNASFDGTCEAIRQRFPGVKTQASTKNLGFGGGNNLGLHAVTTPFALVLNPDVRLPAGGIQQLLELAMVRPEVAITGPWPARDTGIASAVKTSGFGSKILAPYLPDTDYQTQFLVGAAMLMRMEAMRTIGFFDPEIFLYYEDDDISERAVQAGYKLLLTSRVLMHHNFGSSSSDAPGLLEMKERHFSWSRLYLDQKIHGTAHAHQTARELKQKYRRRLLQQRLTFSREVAKTHARLVGVSDFLSGQRPPIDPAACTRTARRAA